MRILGVDPGAKGALALLDGSRLEIFDMPRHYVRRGKTDKAEIDGAKLWSILQALEADHLVIEQVGGMTGQSASAAFNFGRAAAAPEYMAVARGWAVTRVPPQTWKKALRVLGGKDAAVARASNLFPRHTGLWAAVRGNGDADQREGRAEAALIAEYGRRSLAMEDLSRVDIFA